MLPSASLSEDGVAMYEPIHGSAPDFKGQNRLNPIATILSAAMMLKYSFNLDKEADSKAWHYLRSVKGQSYTETVINALLNHDLADLIEEKFIGLKLQALPEEKQISEIEQEENDDIIFNFLDSF